MDYSQFLYMPQELGLLVVFLLVFLFDTFGPKRSQSSLPVLTAVLFGIFTVCNGFMLMRGTAFSGMFESTAATYVMKVILNIGVLIVLIQSIKWANSEEMAIRRGEFYELLLLTVFGMYLMISATSCCSSSALRRHRCRLPPLLRSTRNATSRTRLPPSTCSLPCSRRQSS